VDPQKRLVRKEILRTLKHAGEEYGATAELIAQSLSDGGYGVTVPEVEQHMRYLAGPSKDYIRVQVIEIEGVGRRMKGWMLPRGVDLIEKNIPADPGVAG